MGDFKLCDKFQRLFAIETTKSCMVKYRLFVAAEHPGSQWSWRHDPRGREVGEMAALQTLLSDVSLVPNQQDSWRCDYVSNGPSRLGCWQPVWMIIR